MREKINTLIRPQNRLQIFLYLTVSGVLSGFCITFPTKIGAVLEWFSLIPAALVLYNVCLQQFSIKKAYWGAFWLVYSQHLIVYHWFISLYPLDFTGMNKLAAAGVVTVAVFGLSLLAAVFSGFLGALVVASSRLTMIKKYPLMLPILAASAYVLNEWFRTLFWIGVPWSRLALGQLIDDVPYTVLTSSIFGTYFVTFLIVLFSFLLAQSLFLNRFKLRVAIAVVLVVLNLFAGVVISKIPIEEKNVITVAAIQGNINSRDKWEGEKTAVSIFKTYYNLTIQAADDGAQLILWPETSLPDDYFIPYLSNLCKEYGICLLFGTFDFNENGEPGNALYLIDSNGDLSENIYLKQHLVPFGEYVPMRNLIMTIFPPLCEIAMLEYDLIPGDDSNVFTVTVDDVEVNIGGLICFDSIYEELAYGSSADGADMICVATNDSWFEDSRAVHMHCAQSRLRAIETRLPIVRAANTGISAVITENGEVVEMLEPLVTGYIISDIPIDGSSGKSDISNEIFLWLMILIIYIPIVLELTVFHKFRRK